MMCIIRHHFITKKALRGTLIKLVNENYLTLNKYNTYTIYYPKASNINDTIKTYKHSAIVMEILNTTKETYLISAVFHNVILFVCLETSAMVLKF